MDGHQSSWKLLDSSDRLIDWCILWFLVLLPYELKIQVCTVSQLSKCVDIVTILFLIAYNIHSLSFFSQ